MGVDSSTKRKPGGQPRNRNALKHGYFSEFFRPGEIDDLNRQVGADLSGEIALLRVMMRRIVSAVGDGATFEFEDRLHALGTLADAAAKLGSLVRIQSGLGQGSGEIESALSAVLADLAKKR